MKKTLLLILFIVYSIIVQADVINDLVIELESHLEWAAVDKNWANRRDSWIKELKKETGVQRTGAMVAEFESNIVWSAVQSNWQLRRNSWVSEIKAPLTFTNLASLILDLEANIKGSYLGSKWQSRRPGWRSEFTCLATTKKHFADEPSNEVYEFNFNEKTFEAANGKKSALKVLGSQGTFAEERLPELSNQVKKVYRFGKNSGLQFVNKEFGNLFRESYTIELYFRFDALDSWKRVIDFKNRKSDNGAYIFDGKLNFYKVIVSDIAPVKAGEYTHYVISRNKDTKEISIYADGIAKVSFIDQYDLGVLDEENVLNFFHDDKVVENEASSGAVALIKVYGYTLNPAQIKTNYQQLEQTILKTETPSVETTDVIKGKVYNSKTKQIISGATVNTGSSEPSRQTLSGTSGEYTLPLPSGTSFMLIAKATGYMQFSEHVSKPTSTDPMIKDIYLIPIEVGETVILKNIIFQQSKYDLLPESLPELDKLVALLKDNPTLEIELSGHTDNQGDFNKNIELSENRVKAAKDYIVSKGIASSRIKGKGYGSTKPIASNAQEETRKLNRRVEFTILKK